MRRSKLQRKILIDLGLQSYPLESLDSSITGLSKRLNTSKPNVSVSVKLLFSQGLVEWNRVSGHNELGLTFLGYEEAKKLIYELIDDMPSTETYKLFEPKYKHLKNRLSKKDPKDSSDSEPKEEKKDKFVIPDLKF